jgi:hypothetical protein
LEIFMASNDTPLTERVKASYLQLSAVASDLNAVSDELGKSIADIDLALRKLNLGITVWVDLKNRCWLDEQDNFNDEQLGYAKIGGKWGVSLRTESGNHVTGDRFEEESWLFNDAPRTLRLTAIEQVPELLEKLSAEAAETTKKLKTKLSGVQEVSEAVKAAAGVKRVQPPPVPETSGAWSLDAAAAKLGMDAKQMLGHLDKTRLAGGNTGKVQK